MNIYKSKTSKVAPQFSFVFNPYGYYYYLYQDDSWRFCDSRIVHTTWDWCGPAQGCQESSWLEVLVITGFTKEKVEAAIEEKDKEWESRDHFNLKDHYNL